MLDSLLKKQLNILATLLANERKNKKSKEKKYFLTFKDIAKEENHPPFLLEGEEENIKNLLNRENPLIVKKAKFILIVSNALKNNPPSPSAKCALGLALLNGYDDVEKDPELANKIIKEAAELGNIDAQYEMGRLLYQIDVNQAAGWLIHAVQQNHAPACFLLAEIHINTGNSYLSQKNDQLVKLNYDRAEALYLQGYKNQCPQYEQANVECAVRLYELLVKDPAKLTDEVKAYLDFAANKNHPLALERLAVWHENQQQYEQTLKAYEKIVNNKDVEINFKIRIYYKMAVLLETKIKNIHEAIKAYQWAGECGNQDACYRLGFIYRDSIKKDEHVIVKSNLKETKKWFDKAIKAYKESINFTKKTGQGDLKILYFNIASAYQYHPEDKLFFAKHFYEKSLENGETRAIRQIEGVCEKIKNKESEKKISILKDTESFLKNLMYSENKNEELFPEILHSIKKNDYFTAIKICKKIIELEFDNNKNLMLIFKLKFVMTDFYIKIFNNTVDKNLIKEIVDYFDMFNKEFDELLAKNDVDEEMPVIKYVFSEKYDRLKNQIETSNFAKLFEEIYSQKNEEDWNFYDAENSEIVTQEKENDEEVEKKFTLGKKVHKVKLALTDVQIQILNILKSDGNCAYVTGEFIVKQLLAGPTTNLCVVTDLEHTEIMDKFKNCSVTINIPFPMVKINLQGHEIYVWSFRRTSTMAKSLLSEALSCDFTVFGMFYDHDSEEIIDYIHAYDDFKNKEIKVKNSKIFKRNPIKMITAIRLHERYSSFGFRLSDEIEDAIKKDKSYFSKKCNKNHLMFELFECFSSTVSSKIFKRLYEYNIYELLFQNSKRIVDDDFFKLFLGKILDENDFMVSAKAPVSYSLILSGLFFSNFQRNLIPNKQYTRENLWSLMANALEDNTIIDIPKPIRNKIVAIWYFWAQAKNLLIVHEIIFLDRVALNFFDYFEMAINDYNFIKKSLNLMGPFFKHDETSKEEMPKDNIAANINDKKLDEQITNLKI